MKRDELIRRIRDGAHRAGKSWVFVREGGRHEIWQFGETTVPIPRHRESDERTATGIMRELEPELGRRWWRR